MFRRKWFLGFLAVLIVTVSGQTTALGGQLAKPSKSAAASAHKPARSRTSTTTTSTIPAAAEPLLKRLLGAAGEISADNAKAAALSETYDQDRVKLKAAKKLVVACDAQVALAESQVERAKLALRKAAVLAYVSGVLTDGNSSLLSNTASDGEMAGVYMGVATSTLHSAVARFVTVENEIASGRREALSTESDITLEVAHIASLRNEALDLVKQASVEYRAVSARLKKLEGAKAFTELFAAWPAGGTFKGKNLAGVAALKPASAAQGVLAGNTARSYRGVPYVFGGASRAGVDCSGLTMLAWAKVGMRLAHSATMQWEESVPVSIRHLRAGDLLFYHFSNDGNTQITHVVMYLGSGPYGAATVIQAAEPGTNVAYSPIYLEGLVSAGRP